MTQMRITVNGDRWLDGDLGEWQQKPPEQFVKALQAPSTQIPGLRQLLTVLAECATQDKSCSLELTNSERGWTLTVEEL
ncbi:hypothetical protein M2272_005867 [Mycobacterium frederiksbergense]|uniref:Uncharacterized protein n=1 Tax=Mycolicibacterium frederiksbergense TaxID=117567 RepID=A0ABT6L8B2_9MYCO|nr:hypothetical protein [Mycolicibacterium frederiksbergense]MDH6199199.1 hypothetical protein [Mycolicibacterium frederiksbergense]